jgi:hypothetical protein
MTAALLFVSPSANGQAATLRVPEDFAAIQQAIDAAASGDSILVGPGLYDENLNAHGKYLTLLGSGSDVTVVDGGSRDRVLTLDGSGIVSGFTFRRGQAFEGAGVWIGGPGPTVLQHCVIEQNVAGYVDVAGLGGGLYVHILAENFRIIDNTIVDNYAGVEGGGIFSTGIGEIRGNLITRNGCHVGGGGVYLSGYLYDNLILENWSDHFGGGLLLEGGEARGNTVVGNIGPAGGAGIDMRSGLAANNLVVGNRGGGFTADGIRCLGKGYPARIECNNAWGNTGEQYGLGGGGGGCDSLAGHNISIDPQFCDQPAGDYHLRPSSPCAAENNPSCGLIGAFPVSVACVAVPARRVTWGMLKRTYR